MNRPGFAGGSNSREAGALTSNTTNKFSSEIRDRAVRMVLERAAQHSSRWAAILSVAARIGCTGQMPSARVKQAERDRRFKP